jgi:hypothetical protein
MQPELSPLTSSGDFFMPKLPLQPTGPSSPHRRAQSHIAPGKILSRDSIVSNQVNGNEGSVRGGSVREGSAIYYNDPTTQHYRSKPGSQAPITISDMKEYSTMRIGSITSLQTYLQNNTNRFISLVEESKKAYAKKHNPLRSPEAIKAIDELNGAATASQRRINEIIKNVQEMFAASQTKVDSALRTKEAHIAHICDESVNFAKSTLKICDQFGSQAFSLKRKLIIFLESLRNDGLQEENIGQSKLENNRDDKVLPITPNDFK